MSLKILKMLRKSVENTRAEFLRNHQFVEFYLIIVRFQFNPFTPRTIQNQEVPSSKITRHCSWALARQQCPERCEKRLFLIKIKC